MLKKSFKNLVRKPSGDLDDMPLIAALTFEKLEDDENLEIITQAPLVCKHCGGILVDYTKLNKSNGNVFSWECEFCVNSNELKIKTTEEIQQIEKIKELKDRGISAEELSIIFKEISEEKETEKEGKEGKEGKSKGNGYGESLVAIIDISGSMSGGKLDAVKHSLTQTVKDIKINDPDTVFSLIAFTDFVDIYPIPKNPIRIEDEKSLFSKDQLKKTLQKELASIKVGPVSEFGDQWVKKIDGLTDMGYTALGPGLYSGQILLEEKVLKGKKSSARIILLTDGLANAGMGNVESSSGKNKEEFYEKLGDECLKKGIIIDLVGVQDSSNAMALDIVGKVTDITGGEMIFISQEKISSTFAKLGGKQYIAKNTVVRVFMPDFLEIDGITGTHISGGIPKAQGAPINFGALDKNREIYLKFRQKKATKVDSVPIQIQLEYLDKDNKKKTRVIRSNIKTIDNFNEYSKSYDAEIMANMEIQEANEKMQKSDMKMAKSTLSNLKKRLSSAKFAGASNIVMAMEMASSEEEDWEALEAEAEATQVADMKSYYASAGQAQTRMSMGARKKAINKKKKK